MTQHETLVSHVEIGSLSAPKTSQFFCAVLDWTYNETSEESGWMQSPLGRVGMHGRNPDFGIVAYFRVPDIELAVQRVREHSGTAGDVVTEPGWGRFSNCMSPEGARFGLHQP